MRILAIKANCVAALMLCFGAAQAQDAAGQAKADDGILVTGQREIEPKVVHRYVRQISSTVDGQLTRFSQPVCPMVRGFAPDVNAVVERRIRKVAADAQAPVGEAGCRANLIVLVTKNADTMVKDLRQRAPELFEGLTSTDLQRAFRDGPVHLWNTTLLLNDDGQRQIGSTMTVKSASILNLPTQQAIIGSMAVIDQEATIGKTLAQIGDYVAMRALVGAKPPAVGIESDTILTLFNAGGVAPPGLTLVDKSYIAGVYDTSPMMHATSAMGRISSKIRRDAARRAQGED